MGRAPHKRINTSSLSEIYTVYHFKQMKLGFARTAYMMLGWGFEFINVSKVDGRFNAIYGL
ncbi:hypothetical protein [Neobacillus sp.]|uniref:hypothetical protein n=1 Tax=Neobacillus sp. TaxID=2675273 RepID=UPI002896345D|nr:hypothetical protein [Neobacillus sp.]